MKGRLDSKEQITELVVAFYARVKTDDVIGHIFRDLKHFDWDTHIPIMIDFWQTVLLHEGAYKGNPIRTHVLLNRDHPLNDEHFARWKLLFFATLDELFEGKIVDEAKKRVNAMEALMKFKIAESVKPGFVQ